MIKKTFIYGLYSNDDQTNIRYVGKADNPKNRLKRHIQNTKYAKKKNLKLTHKDYWIILNNFNINYIILEECEVNEWTQREIFYIKKYENLTNTSSGGLGGSGIKYKLSYDNVKFWIKNNIIVNSKTEWDKFTKLNILPDFIPNNPREVYIKKGWISWGDFLNTINKNSKIVDYVSYDEAKKLLKTFNIKSINEYRQKIKEKLIQLKIPYRPERYYKKKGWISWCNYLSNNNVANQNKEFVNFENFKKIIKYLNIKSYSEFKKIRKNICKKYNLPTNPNIVYKNLGWFGWANL